MVVVRRVLEQAVARVEHLMREEEEPLAGDAGIVEHVRALKLTMSRLRRSYGRRCMIARSCRTWHRRSGASPAGFGSRRSSAGSLACTAARPHRPSTAAAGRPTWSCACSSPQSKCTALTSCAFPNPMAVDLARRGRRRRQGRRSPTSYGHPRGLYRSSGVGEGRGLGWAAGCSVG